MRPDSNVHATLCYWGKRANPHFLHLPPMDTEEKLFLKASISWGSHKTHGERVFNVWG